MESLKKFFWFGAGAVVGYYILVGLAYLFAMATVVAAIVGLLILIF
jgi:hypothetical protein